MADNLAWTPGVGATIATDEDASAPNAHYQLIKPVWGPLNTFNIVDTASGKPLPIQLRSSTGEDVIKHEDDASADLDPGIVIFAKRGDAPSATSGTDGDYEPLQVSNGQLWTTALSKPFTVSVDTTRPADVLAYAVDDAIANATAAASVQTYSNVARVAGGSLLITDVMVISSNNAPATMLQGEIWLLDTAPTANNDNVAFTLTDAEIKTVVAVIPFTLAKASANNCIFHATRLNIVCTTSGSANLTGQLKAKNAYTPANAEVLTVRIKGFWLN